MPPAHWEYNEENPMDYDVVIVDEFSMCDIFLFRHLLEGIDFNRTKLLLIGDDAQIPSVGAGNVLYDLLCSECVPTVTLKKVFRYEPEVFQLSQQTRDYKVNILIKKRKQECKYLVMINLIFLWD